MLPDDPVWLELGAALYRRRIELGITSQEALAKRAGLHRNTIGKVERGEPWSRPGQAWSKIEAALELEPGWIDDFVARHRANGGRMVTAGAIEQAVLDSINDHSPHLPIRQARRIAAATVQRLTAAGLLPDQRG